MGKSSKQNIYEDIADRVDLCRAFKGYCEQMAAKEFEDLSRNDWEAAQELLDASMSLLTQVESALIASLKIHENEALMSHMDAVLSAED